MEPTNHDEIRQAVRKAYEKVARATYPHPQEPARKHPAAVLPTTRL